MTRQIKLWPRAWREQRVKPVPVTYLVHPVLALVVADAPVQRFGRQHQYEALRLLYALQQVVVELSGFQTLDVDEHRVPSELQMYFEQTKKERARYVVNF